MSLGMELQKQGWSYRYSYGLRQVEMSNPAQPLWTRKLAEYFKMYYICLRCGTLV